MDSAATFSPLEWTGSTLRLIDQLALPAEERWITCTTADEVASAIRDMQVRGAPAIGIAAGYGVALAARAWAAAAPEMSPQHVEEELERVIAALTDTRPTAVNLSWALREMRAAALVALGVGGAQAVATALEVRAVAIHRDDVAMCRRIGQHGAALVPDDATVLTHCNAGALATGGYGTALGVLRAAREAGKRVRVIADETRPFLQGARLTAWELCREGFDVTLVPDAAAAFLLRCGEIQCVIVGADRIAANGDVANKIGTYGVALAAHQAGVPFYVAAPRSTVDLATADGDAIPIEERSGDEVVTFAGTRVAPEGVRSRYPAFDVTPAELVDAIITDAGVARAPYDVALAELCSGA